MTYDHPMSQPWTDWRTIDSAPRDGSRVMIWDGKPYFARWSDEAEFGDGTNFRPGWQIFDCEGAWYAIATDSATHWAPEPKGPHND